VSLFGGELMDTEVGKLKDSREVEEEYGVILND